MHDNNEISVLQYAEDSNHFDAVAVYSHPDQVWAMDSSPKDSSLLVTSRQSQNNSKSLTVWRMAKQAKEDLEEDAGAYSTETLDLAEVATFNQSQKPALVRSVKWHKTDDKLLSIDNKFLAVWDAESGKVTEPSLFLIVFSTQSHHWSTATGGAGRGQRRQQQRHRQLGQRLRVVGPARGEAVRGGAGPGAAAA